MPSAPSSKRMLIDKTNARLVIYIGIAAFIVIFSAVATKTLISQARYQNKVISAKRSTVSQLKADIAATDQLKKSYTAFVSTAQNVIGGNTDGIGQNDGDNAKIVLDALPSNYDFPGLTTSIQRLLGAQSVDLTSISGTDDEANQAANQTSANPTAIAIPFSTVTSSDYAGVQRVIAAYEHSIRPMQIQKFDLNGDNQSGLKLNISAQTFYQPAKQLTVGKKGV